MDQAAATASVSSRNHEDTEMEQISSHLQALKKLYGLLHRGPADDTLDDSSRALLMKILNDATQQTLLRQAKLLSGSMMPPALERKVSVRSDRNHEDMEMEQISSDLQALKKLYELLHKDPADDTLDEPSRALLMKMLDDATQQTLLRQAKLLSGSMTPPALERKVSVRSDRRPCDAAPRLTLRPPASPSPSVQAGAPTQRLTLHRSTVSSRAGHGHGHAAGEPLLVRLSSNRTSRTALPPRHRPVQEHPRSGLNLHRLSVAPASRHGTVAESARRDDHHWDGVRGDPSSSPLEFSSRRRAVFREPSLGRTSARHDDHYRDGARRSPDRGDPSSSLQFSSRPRAVSREPSQGRTPPRGPGTARHAVAESSSSTRHFRSVDSGCSPSVTSRRGSERDGRGAATPECSSSSNTFVTIHSRIRPHGELTERQLRFPAEEEASTSRRRRKNSSISGAGWGSSSGQRRPLHPIDSVGSVYSSRVSSNVATSSPSTSPTVSPASSASASASCSSPVSVSRRGSVRAAAYVSEASASMRSRRRRERQERREGRLRKFKERRENRLRKFKEKIAMVFHHRQRQDHHHHRHLQEAGPSSWLPRHDRHRKSPWQNFGETFHRKAAQVKKTTSRAVVSAPAKRRGGRGGGQMHALFDAVLRHMRHKRKKPPSARMKGTTASRVQAKRIHWWQRLRQPRGRPEGVAGSKPRRRLGHGKAV